MGGSVSIEWGLIGEVGVGARDGGSHFAAAIGVEPLSDWTSAWDVLLGL